MKNNRVVLHLIRSEFGGAGQYSMGIHHHMLELGYCSFVSVNGKKLIGPNGEETLIIKKNRRYYWNKFRRFLFREWASRWGKIDDKYLGYNLCERYLCHDYRDLLSVMPQVPTDIMVHWVSGYANAEYVSHLQCATGARVYYWMIDEAPLSGACHYPWDCVQYQTGCYDCPLTTSKLVKIGIRKNFIYKEKHLVQGKYMVLPTEFDRIRMEKSLLWKGTPYVKMIEIVDEDLFLPIDSVTGLRELFQIPQGKRVVFFGSGDVKEERKGIATLMEALSMIDRDDVVYLVAGKYSGQLMSKDVISIGYVDIPTLVKAYQVADVFVCSSLEDSGPQMINQSLMCGTPVVAFEMGVALDIVITGKTGYLAKWNDARDMARGINSVLDMEKVAYEAVAMNCRKLAMDTFSKSVFKQTMEKLMQNGNAETCPFVI